MLELCKFLLEKLCLWPLASSMRPISYLRFVIILSIESTVLAGSFVYVLQNLDDIDEATEPGFVCFGRYYPFRIFNF